MLGKSLAEARQRRKATAEILRVISRSPTDAQPVFDGIANAAVRLTGGVSAAVTRLASEVLHLAALTATSEDGDQILKVTFPCLLSEQPTHRRAIQSRTPYSISDTETLASVRRLKAVVRARGFRSAIWVPLLRDRVAVGTIAVTRRDPGSFSDDQVELLKTVADQAVIAIEIVRLIKELQAQTEALSRSVNQLTALGEVGQAISSSLDLKTVLKTIVSRALMLTGLDVGSISEYD
jgi:GAF domain-containing protein